MDLQALFVFKHSLSSSTLSYSGILYHYSLLSCLLVIQVRTHYPRQDVPYTYPATSIVIIMLIFPRALMIAELEDI